MLCRLCFLSFFVFAAAHSVYAQKTAANTKAPAVRKVIIPQAYIGNSEYMGGPIQKAMLSELLKQGLTSRDSAGNKYRVAGFEFGYAERMMYEDSLGNLNILMDYNSEYCTGDTLSPGIASSIYQRFKAGDTVYINRVTVMKMGAAGGSEIVGKGMKCIITR